MVSHQFLNIFLDIISNKNCNFTFADYVFVKDGAARVSDIFGTLFNDVL